MTTRGSPTLRLHDGVGVLKADPPPTPSPGPGEGGAETRRHEPSQAPAPAPRKRPVWSLVAIGALVVIALAAAGYGAVHAGLLNGGGS